MIVGAGEAHIGQPRSLGAKGEAGRQYELGGDAETHRVPLTLVADHDIGGADRRRPRPANPRIAAGLRAAEGVEAFVEIMVAGEGAQLVPGVGQRVITDVCARVADAAIAERTVG